MKKVKLSFLALVISSALVPVISNAALSENQQTTLENYLKTHTTWSNEPGDVIDIATHKNSWGEAMSYLSTFKDFGLPNIASSLPNPDNTTSNNTGSGTDDNSPKPGTATHTQNDVDTIQNSGIKTNADSIKQNRDYLDSLQGQQSADEHTTQTLKDTVTNNATKEQQDSTKNHQDVVAVAGDVQHVKDDVTTLQDKNAAMAQRIANEEAKRTEAEHRAQIAAEHAREHAKNVAEQSAADAATMAKNAAESAVKHNNVKQGSYLAAVIKTLQPVQTTTPVDEDTYQKALEAQHAAEANKDSQTAQNSAPDEAVTPQKAPTKQPTQKQLEESNRERVSSQHVAPYKPGKQTRAHEAAMKDNSLRVALRTANGDVIPAQAPVTETVKGQYSQPKEVHASKLNVTPSAAKDHKGTSSVTSSYAHDSSAKRDHLKAGANQATTITQNAATQDDVNNAVSQENQYLNNRVSDVEGEFNSALSAESQSRITEQAAYSQADRNYTDSQIQKVQKQQSADRKEYRGGIASVAAISGLHYTDNTANSIAIGAANFKNANGYAFGYKHQWQDKNISTTASVADSNSGDAVIAGSLSVGW
ncbi:hypothetical protein ACJJVG_08775 [Pseudocitrobacter faecalis]|uniref:hypothetical protein n=1 Tax=Pseudocitrobacter faecalis TaxID=1398493 RepID=UPI00389A9021